MDSVKSVLLCACGKVKLTCGRTELAVNTPCKVVLGCSLHVRLKVLAEKLCKLRSMLCLLVCSLFPIKTDLGIALSVSNSCHAEVHTNLGALAVEVSHKLVEDELLVLIGNVGVVLNCLCVNAVLMLSRKLCALFHYLELGTGNLANGTYEISRHLICFVNVTANGANKFFHNFNLLMYLNFDLQYLKYQHD